MRRDPRLAQEVERRLEYTLASDRTARHQGVLRTPEELVLYRRGEIVNHVGAQFDPAKHNTGVLRFGTHFALLAQLDTTDARAQHQYQNAFLEDGQHFSWQSQNQQTPETGTGREIAAHRALGNTIHLFVQGRAERLYFYLGPVTVVNTEGERTFVATFELSERLPGGVSALLDPQEAVSNTFRR